MKEILAIVGPTASGKSALALALAKRLGGEIISCDSMQVYKRMNVGTAKPTESEMSEVRHHLIDVADPAEPFSCAEYVSLATEAIADCHSRGVLPVVCGGTGLYLDALLRKNDLPENTVNENIRAELMDFAAREGADALWEMLREIDPQAAEATHKNNVKRVARAIEIFKVSGRTKTELDAESREGGYRYDACVIGLKYPDRARLYERIDRRVDVMLSDGLVEEAKALDREGVFEKNSTAAQAIGYKEILPYCRGEIALNEAAEALKTATRRYAKRQMTWFSAKDYVSWIELDGQKTFEEIVNYSIELFKSET